MRLLVVSALGLALLAGSARAAGPPVLAADRDDAAELTEAGPGDA